MAALNTTMEFSSAKASRGVWGEAWRRLLGHKLAVVGLAFIVLIALAALLAPLIAPYDPIKQDYNVISQGPNAHHWFGTDQLGRDVFSRVLFGARTALAVSFGAAALALSIGIAVGAVAGYVGGRIDNLLMRGVDIVYAFPDLLFIILLRVILGGGIPMLFIAIGLTAWTGTSRLVRGQVLAAKDLEYVTAARAVGASQQRILAMHILPNAIGPVVVAAAFMVPRAIFAEAALSYIGIGIRPPTPSWGGMLQEGYTLVFAAPHLVIFPVIAIALLMMAFAFLGDGLRDALDPRAERRG